MNLYVFIIYLGLGAIAGSLLVFFGKRLAGFNSAGPISSGGGALWGAVATSVFLLGSGGCTNSTAMDASTANVAFIGEKEFESAVLKSSIPVLVDFYATWCGPCQIMSPRVDEVAGDLAGKVKFFKVNVDKAPGLAQKYDIHGIPALLLFQNGKVIDTMIGARSEDELKSHCSLQAKF